MSDCFRFIKVEDFFNGYQAWNTVGDVTSHAFDSKQQLLSLGVAAPDTPLGTAALLLQVPMFVRAGAVIPTIELEQYVGERHANGQLTPITLNVYPGQSSRYTMYLDDGVSRSSAPAGDDPAAKGEYRETHISHSWTGNKTRWITISRGHDGYTPPEPYFFVGVLHDPGETEGLNGPLQNVSVNATPVYLLSGGSPKDRADRLAASVTAAWYHNEHINISFLKIFDDRANITVELAYT